jgi:uncharacterized membrane protein
MNMRPLLIVNTALIAAMVGFSAWAWQMIPDGAQLPVHWNLDGVVDRLGSKTEALMFLPALAIGVTALLWFLPRLDPRRANIDASGKFWNAIAIATVALLAYLHGLMILSAVGQKVVVFDQLTPAVGALMIVIGNYLSKTRSNWFGGVRTPWTMSSEYSWEKTHRWAGRLFMASGVASIATWFVAGSVAGIAVLVGAVLAAAVVSVILSYVFWKNDPTRAGDAHSNGST